MKKHFPLGLFLIAIFVLLVGYTYNKQVTAETVKSTELQQNEYEKDQKNLKEQELLEYPWTDKNWYAIGDSITHNNIYQSPVKQGLNLKFITTDAFPGEQIGTMVSDITKDKLKNVDLITVFGGTNDYGGNKPLGSIADSKEADTFYGNLKNLIETINENKINEATIVFFTPLKRGEVEGQPTYPEPNGWGYTLENYVSAIKTVCEEYSIPVIDLFNKSGIEVSNLEKYTGDNLHPNDKGYELISEVMIEELNNIKPKE